MTEIMTNECAENKAYTSNKRVTVYVIFCNHSCTINDALEILM